MPLPPRMVDKLPVVFAIALVVVPAVDAQAEQSGALGVDNPSGPTPVALFFHLLDARSQFPVSPQEPPLDWGGSFDPGPLATSSCSSQGDAPGPVGDQFHTWRGFSFAGIATYDFLVDGRPRFVGEDRPLTYDIQIDDGGDAILHWFVEVVAEGGTSVPSLVPEVVVRAAIREGNVAVSGATYDEGRTIASGETEPALLAGEQSQGVLYEPENGRHVYHFQVPLEIEQDFIPRAAGFNVRVDLAVKNVACNGDDTLAPDLFNLYTSPERRPRLNLSVMDPIRIEYLHPQFVGEDLAIHVSARTPWGDSAPVNVTYSVTVTDGRETSNLTFENGTFVLSDVKERFENASLEIVVVAQTEQGWRATATARLTTKESLIHDNICPGQYATLASTGCAMLDEEKDAPGPGLALLVALISAACIGRRRGSSRPCHAAGFP